MSICLDWAMRRPGSNNAAKVRVIRLFINAHLKTNLTGSFQKPCIYIKKERHLYIDAFPMIFKADRTVPIPFLEYLYEGEDSQQDC